MTSTERIRLAQGLHDGVAQDLAALGYKIDQILADEDWRSHKRKELRNARFAVDALISQVRDEIYELRRPLNSLKSELIAAANSIGGNAIQLTLDEVEVEPEKIRELVVIASELLRNALAHARASQIELSLYQLQNRILLEICDNGVGGAQVKDSHWGISGVFERAASIGATVNFRNDNGTRISILI